MAYVRTILTDNHPTLRKVAKKFGAAEIADPKTRQLVEDMFETMYAAPGIGLAAPQVNVSKRMFVVDLGGRAEDHPGPFVIFNPRFTLTENPVEMVEGCLSIPGFIGDVDRFEHVVCVGVDLDGKKVEYDATGLFAQCLQHEMDHLDGVLYTDKARNVRKALTAEEIEAAEAAASEAAAEVALSS